MKLIKRATVCMLSFIMVLSLVATFNSISVSAVDLEDNLNGGNRQSQSQGQSNNLFDGIRDQDIGDAQNVGDILGNQTIMSSEHLSQANAWAAPLTNLIGYIIGGIVTLTIVAVSCLTALDIFYISVPPARNLLYKAGTDGTGAYNGGFGMGASGGTAKPTQWVSDEAVSCAALLGGSAQSMQNGMGMGMGMGMPEPSKPKVRSVIWVYLKKRAVFLVLLMVAILVLTSSALMGTGINLAQWLLRVIMTLNGAIA